MEDALESERGADRSGDLGDDVRGDLDPGEVAQGCEGNGQGRVEVGAGDVAGRKDYDHDSEAGACRVPNQGLGVGVLLVHDRASRGGEYEDEGPDELRS